MEATQVIHRPMVTEKSTYESDEFNRVTFQVNKRASKPQIRRAIEELYNVRVIGVATQNRKGRMRRNRFGYWQSPAWKKAVVQVHPEDRIELF